ncbi:MAG: hypothetical protein SFV19_09860 [Rhodospirillaceae bacterium]|nr:hypothetical protein [Rhodospirillaceae bacterium]
MVFHIDPDKPDIPAMATILQWMGIFCMIGCISALLLAFSGYEWVNDVYAFAGAIMALLFALLFVGQAKTLELQAVISARVKSRFAMEGALGGLGGLPAAGGERKPPIIPQKQTERVIKVPEKEAREQGLRLR